MTCVGQGSVKEEEMSSGIFRRKRFNSVKLGAYRTVGRAGGAESRPVLQEQLLRTQKNSHQSIYYIYQKGGEIQYELKT